MLSTSFFCIIFPSLTEYIFSIKHSLYKRKHGFYNPSVSIDYNAILPFLQIISLGYNVHVPRDVVVGFQFYPHIPSYFYTCQGSVV